MRKFVGAMLAVCSTIVFFVILSQVASPTGVVVQSEMQDIEDKVAKDAVDQYDIAARSGNAIDRCVHAGLVAAGYLQAKDEAHYKTWKATERRDCRAAGMPE
jgi:hypothetical protein